MLLMIIVILIELTQPDGDSFIKRFGMQGGGDLSYCGDDNIAGRSGE